MELVVGIGLALGGTGAAGAASAVGITAAAAPAAISASTALTAISGVSTAFGVIAAIGDGQRKETELKAQAAEQEFLATEEFIRGQEEEAELKKQLALTLQRQRVSLASGGVDLSSPSAIELEKQVTADAERQLDISGNRALLANLARRRNARNLRIGARTQVGDAVLGQVGNIGKFATGVIERG